MLDSSGSTTHSFPLVEREAASRLNACNGVSPRVGLDLEGAEADLGNHLIGFNTQSLFSLITRGCEQKAGTLSSPPIGRNQFSGGDGGL